MRLDTGHLGHARKVADAILYEGYLLYPYHRLAQKNQARFQFGVLMPPAYRAVDDSEPSANQTECLLECRDDAEVRILVRFLQLQHRAVLGVSPETGELHKVDTLYVDGAEYTEWDEAAEREQHATVSVAALLDEDRKIEFHVGAGESAENLTDSEGRLAGRLIRRWTGLDGVINVHAERVAGPYQALRLRIAVQNRTTPAAPLHGRDDGLRHAFIAAHSLTGVPGGTFLSMTDPPEWAAAEVGACVNAGTWPVLAGPDDCADLMLSSPVILYDHPEIAAESAGDLFDATEIDEILTLRTLALTDAEKRHARATDPRAAELMDRLDDLPPEMLERMHGAIRYLRPAGGPAVTRPAARRRSRRPAARRRRRRPAACPPSSRRRNGRRRISPAGSPAGRPCRGGTRARTARCRRRPIMSSWPASAIARGSRVRMRPGVRRADAQDLFLAGREATVQAVLHDVDGEVHLAVSPEDDPAAELQRNHGRFLYFSPDEIEPASPAGATETPG